MFASAPSSLTIAVISTRPQQHGGKRLISVYGLQAIMMGSQRRNLRQELKHRPWRSVAYWLALHGSSACFLHTQVLSVQRSYYPSGLGSPTLTINQENVLCGLVVGNGGIFSTEGPSFQVTLACVKLTRN